MDEFVKIIFENAIIREEQSYKMFMDFADKADNPKLKEVLVKLAEEEILHENLLKKQDLTTLKIANRQDLEDLNILKKGDKMDMSYNEIKEINLMLDFAIEKEQEFHDDYVNISINMEFGPARELFEELARQETRHKVMLQKVKLDFNDNDWKSIS